MGVPLEFPPEILLEVPLEAVLEGYCGNSSGVPAGGSVGGALEVALEGVRWVFLLRVRWGAALEGTCCCTGDCVLHVGTKWPGVSWLSVPGLGMV